MTLGSATAALFVFFAFEYHGIGLDWWGNGKIVPNFRLIDADAFARTVDFKGFQWYPVPEGGFGPAPGEFE